MYVYSGWVEGGSTWALNSECKTDQAHLLISQIRYLSYNLTSWRKSSLIQNSSPKIPKAFNEHGISKKIRET